LKKINGDLEAQKKNVFSLESTIGEWNVIPLKPRINESSNPCGLKLAIQIMRSFTIQTGKFDREMLG
jgi:hypothetical protein